MADSLYAEMVKSLKPGVRVKRGRDWNYGDGIDGNGEGTITGTCIGLYSLYKVKWDFHDKGYLFRMDAGKYDLQIVNFAMPSTNKSDQPLAKKLFWIRNSRTLRSYMSRQNL